MLKAVPRLCLVCVLALLCTSFLRAEEPTAYRIGDVAEKNIFTPVALDVIDPAATAALKASEALKTPAIFISCSGATNAIANEFLVEFAGVRSNFVAAVQSTFHHARLDGQTIASLDFGYLVTAFNIKNRDFPLPAALADDWARGSAGLSEQNKWLGALLQAVQQPSRPDDWPTNFVVGETVRLVPAGNSTETITVNEAEAYGRIVKSASVISISRLRAMFCGNFPMEDEQPLAHALAEWLKPNCFPDAELTQLARDRAVSQLVVAEHFAAGQILIRQGAVIDARAKALLDQVNEKLVAGAPPPQIVVAPVGVLDGPPKNVPVANQPAPDETLKTQSPVAAPFKQTLKINERETWGIVGSAVIGMIVTLFTMMRLASRRRRGIPSPAGGADLDLRPHNLAVLQAELAPGLAQAVREALVQELAMQRRELILAQQMAAAEIAEVVRRLDALQVPLQKRLQAYELQIQRLEKELAERNAENSELLRLKIEMMRHQLESESVRNRAELN
jgi:7TM-HD extracellular